MTDKPNKKLIRDGFIVADQDGVRIEHQLTIEEQVDAFVRDLCTVTPQPKSAVRARINELLAAAREEGKRVLLSADELELLHVRQRGMRAEEFQAIMNAGYQRGADAMLEKVERATKEDDYYIKLQGVLVKVVSVGVLLEKLDSLRTALPPHE